MCEKDLTEVVFNLFEVSNTPMTGTMSWIPPSLLIIIHYLF